MTTSGGDGVNADDEYDRLSVSYAEKLAKSMTRLLDDVRALTERLKGSTPSDQEHANREKDE